MHATTFNLVLLEILPFALLLIFLSPWLFALILTPFISIFNVIKNTILYVRHKPITVERSNGDYIYHPIVNFWKNVLNAGLYIIGPIFAWKFMTMATNNFTQTIFTVRVNQNEVSMYSGTAVLLFLLVLLTTYLDFYVNKPSRNYPYIKDDSI